MDRNSEPDGCCSEVCLNEQRCLPSRRQHSGSCESVRAKIAGPISERLNKKINSVADPRRMN
jgi:hypothetical protein